MNGNICTLPEELKTQDDKIALERREEAVGKYSDSVFGILI